MARDIVINGCYRTTSFGLRAELRQTVQRAFTELQFHYDTDSDQQVFPSRGFAESSSGHGHHHGIVESVRTGISVVSASVPCPSAIITDHHSHHFFLLVVAAIPSVRISHDSITYFPAIQPAD
jgi:hypothetical protein